MFDALQKTLSEVGQQHLLRFWDALSVAERDQLAAQIASIDFPLIQRLSEHWIHREPDGAEFSSIEPVHVVPTDGYNPRDHAEAGQAGEEALRAGRVGLVLVAGGQGTRLGYSGPKGVYPIGPLTGRSLFAYHADKIHNAQARFGCTLPWYIMVGENNAEATRDFFEAQRYFELNPDDIRFFQQDMIPSVDEDGKCFLESASRIAMNPNGHGGCIPALVESGILDDAESRGIDTLSYFQVDNWAVKVADPHFIGYHLLRNGQMSSKVHRKKAPRESAGVFCVCDGKVRVIEYTELDIYPELLETLPDGTLLHYAANAAIHVVDTAFIRKVYDRFDAFPWHCSHKKIAHVDEAGNRIEPDEPNGYKFETFVFDALAYAPGEQLTYALDEDHEFAAVKEKDGPHNSVASTRAYMSALWREWLEAAGAPVSPSAQIEINPRFAWSKAEFVEKTRGYDWPDADGLVIDAEGNVSVPDADSRAAAAR